jgi:hypothetical protein
MRPDIKPKIARMTQNLIAASRPVQESFISKKKTPLCPHESFVCMGDPRSFR